MNEKLNQKKMQYTQEVLNLDVSQYTPYINKLERLMSTYLKKENIVLINDVMLMNPNLKEFLPQCEIHSFRTDKRFVGIEHGFAVTSKDNNIIQEIRGMTEENLDYQIAIVTIAEIIAIEEDILEND